MDLQRLSSDIKDLKIIKDDLFDRVQDKTIPAKERQQYYSDYLLVSEYYLKLNSQQYHEHKKLSNLN